MRTRLDLLAGAGNRARDRAAGWIVRGAGHPAGDTDALDAWLAEKPDNGVAYAGGLAVWDELGAVGARVRSRPPSPPKVANDNRRSLIAAVMAVAAAICLVVLSSLLSHRDPAYATRTGEQRLVRLEDGSSVTLNTDTRLRVAFEKGRRNVYLDQGEALFEVAHDSRRPFVVTAAKQRVTATGTAFVVRRAPAWVEVTLLNGGVRVEGSGAAETRPLSLSPGERIRRNLDGPGMVLDRPNIDSVIAWCNGQVLFDRTRVADAIAEMNRYQQKPIVLKAQRELAPLSGVFRTDHGRVFARTLARLYDLKFSETPDAIILTEG